MDNPKNQAKNLSTSLVEWFAKNKRDLPWRKTTNPYFIWISEVMLQQTQVETVIPYYERFITRFPTMYDLARAKEDVLLKEWEGLGYYSRARNLQKGVKEVIENYSAIVPHDKKELLNVKGIGPYTAGAILSIAYNRPVPAVDGNVMRVASRLFKISEDISKASTRKLFEAKMQEYIPVESASDFNQGLMELGALICKPKAPRCEVCPLLSYCMAYKEGIQETLPIKKKAVKQKKLKYTVLVLRNNKGRFYIQKRPKDGLLAGLWEFPMVPLDESENGHNKVKNSFEKNVVAHMELRETGMKITHVFSHLKWELNVVYGMCHQKLKLEQTGKWISKEELDTYPFSVPHQKIKNNLDAFIWDFK